MAEPKWKAVACAKCGALAGQMCMKLRLGTCNHWIRTAPHAARLAAIKAGKDRP